MIKQKNEPRHWEESEETRLAATRAGEEILDAIRASGKRIRIEEPEISDHLDTLWTVRCRKGKNPFVTATIAGIETFRYSGTPTGKIRISVKGRWSKPARHFRQRKDGSFNFEAIAVAVDELIDEWARADEDRMRLAQGYAECQRAINAAGEKHGVDVSSVSPQDDRTATVTLSMKMNDIDGVIGALATSGLLRVVGAQGKVDG